MKLKEIKFNSWLYYDIPKDCKKYVLGFQELKNTEFYRKKIEDLEEQIINLKK